MQDGTNSSRITDFGAYGRVSSSKDGNAVVLGLWDGGMHTKGIYRFDLQNSTLTRLTSNDSSLTAYSPVFSPDEKKIAYVLRHGPNEQPMLTTPYFFKIKTINTDGSGEETVIELPFEGYPGDTYLTWSPDGKKLAFNYGSGMKGDIGSHIFIIDSDGTELTQITHATSFDGAPSWIK